MTAYEEKTAEEEMTAYEVYKNSICNIPDFLSKYLELDIMQRLKDISLFCGMDYASPYMYYFKYPISRYDHSLNVALITWKLTHDKKQTLAALFHDVSTPVFSHVIDYMNGDYCTQETTEDKTREVLLSSNELLDYLNEDNIDINEVINFKDCSVVDLHRPALCADRIENIIGAGMSWVNVVDLNTAIEILDDLTLAKNENNKEEIAIKHVAIAEYVTYINDCINEATHSNSDTYMMILLADIVRKVIEDGYIIYDDLFRLTEHEFIKMIEDYLPYNYELADMWHTFKNVEKPSKQYNIEVKDMTLNPLVGGSRLHR